MLILVTLLFILKIAAPSIFVRVSFLSSLNHKTSRHNPNRQSTRKCDRRSNIHTERHTCSNTDLMGLCSHKSVPTDLLRFSRGFQRLVPNLLVSRVLLYKCISICWYFVPGFLWFLFDRCFFLSR